MSNSDLEPSAPAPPPSEPSPSLGPGLKLLAVLAYVAFVAGGLVFGAVLLTNWQRLSEPGRSVSVPLPGGGNVTLPAAPRLPVPGGSGGQPALPGLPPLGDLKPSVVLPDWNGTERINILALGIDARPDESPDRARSDTLLVASIDPVTKTAALISFPRDLWVEIPGYGENRINVAHPLGGPKLAAQTIERNFGLKVQHWARVDFRGFEQLVDALDGIIVDVERPVKDDEYPTDDYGAIRIYIPPGPQWMHGQTALHYARSRHGDNDFGRMRRQQQVLLAMRDRALSLNVLPKVPTLLALAQKTVATDLGPTELLALAKLGWELDRARISTLVIDAQYATPMTVQGADVLVPNRPAIRQAIAQALAGGPPRHPAKIEVLNGSQRNGLAARTGEYLRLIGYEVVRVETADRSDYPDARILVLTSKTEAAAELATFLHVPQSAIELRPTPGSAIDLRVILGQSFQVPGQ